MLILFFLKYFRSNILHPFAATPNCTTVYNHENLVIDVNLANWLTILPQYKGKKGRRA